MKFLRHIDLASHFSTFSGFVNVAISLLTIIIVCAFLLVAYYGVYSGTFRISFVTWDTKADLL